MAKDFAEMVRATGGPFFEAHWQRSDGTWDKEPYRLFKRAQERLREEADHGAAMGYVLHLQTDEPVFSFGRTSEGLQWPLLKPVTR